MKKIRRVSVLLLLVSTAIFVVFRVYEGVNRDKKPPVITFSEDELEVSVTATEEDLLKGVKAEDNRSGDVSDSLVVESMSNFTEDGVRTITYAAIDDQGNVARCERTLRYEDYQKPQFTLSGPLRFPTGSSIDVFSRVGAQSVLDGELTGSIKYSLENTVDVMNAGAYPIEFRVMDSGGNTVYLNTELEVYDATEDRIKVSLSDYLVYLGVGESFDPMTYYAGSDPEGALNVQSNVDTANPGVYYVDYLVQNGASIGKSRLLVVVE